MTIQVFKRAWWKEEVDRHGVKKIVPHIGRKTVLFHTESEEEAIDYCMRHNNSLEGRDKKFSIKAEWTRI